MTVQEIAEQIADLLTLASKLGAVYNEGLADELLCELTQDSDDATV